MRFGSLPGWRSPNGALCYFVSRHNMRTDTLRPMAKIIRYRCWGCGNKTRFDVTDAVTRRRFTHYSLGGELTVEEEEILERDVLKVVCRWCDRSDSIEEITE